MLSDTIHFRPYLNVNRFKLMNHILNLIVKKEKPKNTSFKKHKTILSAFNDKQIKHQFDMLGNQETTCVEM